MSAVSYAAQTPLSFLERSARVWPDKVAVIYGSRRLTYAEFAAEAMRVAGALRAAGVEPGDRVAYLMPNLPEMLVAHFAVPLAGGILVAINTRLTAEEVSYILRHSGAKILVADAALLPVAAAAAEGVGTITQLVVAADAEAGSTEPDLAGRAQAGELLRVSGRRDGRSDALVGPRRARSHFDQLHLRHHRAPEGRDLHPPRRLPELVCANHPFPA